MREISIDHDGTTYNGQMATIEETRLGYEAHGIFTGELAFGGPSWSQSMSGYRLDGEANHCAEFVMAVIHTVAVDRWEDVRGKQIIVLRPQGNNYGPLLGIAHPLKEDRVLIFADVFAKEHAA